MRKPLVVLTLLIAAGCGKKPAGSPPDKTDPGGATPAAPSREERLAAFETQMNGLGLFVAASPDLLDRGTTVFSLPGGEGADDVLGKIPDPGVPFGLELSVSFGAEKRLTAAGLKRLKVVSNLRYLDLEQQGVGDDGAAALARFTNLQELDLRVNDLSDNGVANLKGLTRLRRLSLSGNGLSDAALPHLAGLTNLTHLEIGPSLVGDDGIKHLAGLRNLTVLVLTASKVTDAGLKQLAEYKKLTRLDLTATAVTDAGVAAFQAALPGCEVVR